MHNNKYLYMFFVCTTWLCLNSSISSAGGTLVYDSGAMDVGEHRRGGYHYRPRVASSVKDKKQLMSEGQRSLQRPLISEKSLINSRRISEKKSDAKPLIVIIHGSKARNEPWYQQKGAFREEIARQGERLHLGEVISYSWSGKSGPPEGRFSSVKIHVDAAEQLVEKIVDYFKKNGPRPLYLIGHSNGGVIAMLVSHMLYNPKRAGKHIDFFEALPLDDPDAKLMLHCRGFVEQAIKRQQDRWSAQDLPFVIERLIMIATPIDLKLYTANMFVTKQVNVLFSLGDGIQRLFGKRRYPKGPNVLNFRVAMKSRGGGIFYPWHTQMRWPVVAQYVLDLQPMAEKYLKTAPARFGDIKGVDILFHANGFAPELRKIEHFKQRAFKAAGF